MNIRRTKKDKLYKLSAVEIYEMVLKRDLKQFPMHFWKAKESIEDAVAIIKYLVEEILKWSDKDIKEKWCNDIVKDNKLGGMAGILFGGSCYKVINAAYPNKFKPWEFKFHVKNYWNIETGIAAVKWLIEEKLKWSDEEIKEKLIVSVFAENGLLGMFQIVFGGSTYRTINSAYPNKFKPWEFAKAPQRYWSMENAIDATKWLIEEKLKWSDEDIKEKISALVFIENDLAGMIQQVFDSSPYDCINTVYPNRFMPWEFPMCSKNYWNMETGMKAIKWLVEEELKISPLEAISQIDSKIIVKYKFEIPYYTIFNASLRRAIQVTYPELKIKDEERIIRIPGRIRKKTPKKDLYKLSAVEIYKMVLNGGLSKFPPNFWQNSDSRVRAVEIIKYLVKEVLKWSDKDIKEKWSLNTFMENGLKGMLLILFDGSSYQAINLAYPNKFNPWEFKLIPLDYWNIEIGIEATKWLIEKKLKWSDEDIKEKMSSLVFKKNCLGKMLREVFDGSHYNCINTVYPNRFMPWELPKSPNYYWNMETGIKAMKWLIEKKLKISPEEAISQIKYNVFMKYKLQTLYHTVFESSCKNAIKAVYPDLEIIEEEKKIICKPVPVKKDKKISENNRFVRKAKREELYKLPAVEIYKMVLDGSLDKFPSKFWNRPESMSKAVEIIKYLVKEIFKWSNKDIKEKWCIEIIFDNKLTAMARTLFNTSPYMVISAAYPNKFKPWEFKAVPLNYWNLETGIEATKWLIEEKLKWSDDKIKQRLTANIFHENGIYKMVQRVFDASMYKAINAAYPNKFKAWEFSKTPQNYWNMETGIEATKWLIEEKLKWSDEEIKEDISATIFSKNGLSGMLRQVFNGSPYNCIKSTYPDRFMPWEFTRCSRNFWDMETGIEAMKWLIEKKLKISPKEAISQIGWTVVVKYKLETPYYKIFEGSSNKIIEAVYPELKKEVK